MKNFYRIITSSDFFIIMPLIYDFKDIKINFLFQIEHKMLLIFSLNK
jgi:hypothetical protein